MLFEDTIALYSHNHYKETNKLFRQNEKLSMSKHVIHTVNIALQMDT